ncbi:MAG: tryptophan synthase subunit beta, partial [Myxococcales bacterium]|nr:tryptophan synthase subunit beta [Myxococcales bacterium]
EALAETRRLARTEGLLVALETAHAFARVEEISRREARTRGRPVTLLVCLSGRGDKDLATTLPALDAAETP